MPRQGTDLPLVLNSDQTNAKTSEQPSQESLEIFAPSPGLPTSAPVSEFQILTSLSSDPVTTRFPSAENATDITEFECPVRVHNCQSHSIQTRSTPKHERNHRKKSRNS